jgi:hypothetical protein
MILEAYPAAEIAKRCLRRIARNMNPDKPATATDNQVYLSAPINALVEGIYVQKILFFAFAAIPRAVPSWPADYLL